MMQPQQQALGLRETGNEPQEGEEENNKVASTGTRGTLALSSSISPSPSSRPSLPCIRTGVEPFVVGLAPNYWSHVPLLISQLLVLDPYEPEPVDTTSTSPPPHDLADSPRRRRRRMVVVDGIAAIPCSRRLSRNRCPSEDVTVTSDADTHNKKQKLVPVTKCVIVGVIVNVDRGSFSTSSSVQYVIDDGTGMMDCLVWKDCAAEEMFLHLLPLPCAENNHHNNHNNPGVGDLVRVYGRIVHFSTTSTSTTGMRELHADLIEPISTSMEIQHWFRCFSFWGSSSDSENNNTNNNNNNAMDILRLLGPQLEGQIRDPSNQPPQDDDIGAWRLFGTRCRCQTSYKEALLYCHCHATPEPLDPMFVFRDILLERLLVMERDQVESVKNTNNHHHDNQQQQQQELRFCYMDLKSDESIDNALTNQALAALQQEEQNQSGSDRSSSTQNVAVGVVVRPTTTNVAADTGQQQHQQQQQHQVTLLKDRLLRRTFHALCQDGIIALLDMATDTYLLISCQRVLTNYFQNNNINNNNNNNNIDNDNTKNSIPPPKPYNYNKRRPHYLSKVPQARLDLVQRRLALAAQPLRQQQQEQQP